MDRPSRRRTQVIAAARRGEDAARDPLLQLLQGDESPYWKAVAAGLLGRWADHPPVRAALTQALQHTNALPRSYAVRALAPAAEADDPSVVTALQRLLEDPARSVRQQAAWALRSRIDLHSLAGSEMLHALDHNSDQPLGQLQLGALQLARTNLPAALAHFQRAVEWDPYSAPLRHERAIALSVANRPAEAAAELETACRLAPTDAEFRFKLALARHETGDSRGALRALEETVALDPTHGRAWYNLGLARNAAGDPQAALTALGRAESLLPADPRIPFARATLLLPLGRSEEARAAAERSLQISPGFQPAAALLRQLPP